MRSLAAVIMLGAALALAPGCSLFADDTVQVSEADSGSTITVATGQLVTVALEANPTTGYQWALDGELPAGVTLEGEPAYDPAPGTEELAGAGGNETWTFKPVAAGRATIRLKYWRSFEPTVPAEKTFSVTLDAR